VTADWRSAGRAGEVERAERQLQEVRRRGEIVSGFTAISSALATHRLAFLLLASDAGERWRELSRRPGGCPEVLVGPWTSAQIGERIGRGPRGALGVMPSGSASFLRCVLRRVTTLG
jgi:hypothetical protein